MIGSRLTRLLLESGYDVTVISRRPQAEKQEFPVKYISWEKQSLMNELNGIEAVVNLAGANISEKWTTVYKQEIIRSRVEPTSLLAETITLAETPPKFFFNMSAVGYYGDTGDTEITEGQNAGNGFLSQVCSKWEAEARKAESRTRLVIGRTGIVLDKKGGALNKLLTSFKSYIGGALGSGRQWMPWVHIDDVTGMILWALQNENVSGAMNIASPKPVRMEEFARTLGKVMNKPSFFRVPAFVIKALMGELAVIVLEGNKAVPAKALELGYGFRHTNLEQALRDLLN